MEPFLCVHQVNLSVDPRHGLSILGRQHKYEEAFTTALQRCDVSIVNWLCSQVKSSNLTTFRMT
jgi:enhancer of mRNA-decapping protein 4